MRESPVASEKIAVDQASRRPGGRSSTTNEYRNGACRDEALRGPVLEVGSPNLLPTASLSGKCAHVGDRSAPIVCQRPLVPSPGPHPCGPFFEMPNIKQQKKRVRTSEEDRGENLRYRSTVKTITRRLEAAVEAGDKDRIAAEHTQLQRWIDRAAARGAIHRNTAARKKAQAARLVIKA